MFILWGGGFNIRGRGWIQNWNLRHQEPRNNSLNWVVHCSCIKPRLEKLEKISSTTSVPCFWVFLVFAAATGVVTILGENTNFSDLWNPGWVILPEFPKPKIPFHYPPFFWMYSTKLIAISTSRPEKHCYILNMISPTILQSLVTLVQGWHYLEGHPTY